MAIILGVDPGLQHTGWGIIKHEGTKLSFVASGTISPNNKASMSERLYVLYNELVLVIKAYKPDQAAIEETFVNKNPLTSLKLGQARGVLILAIAISGLLAGEYAARLIKKAVVGVGSADKNQVLAMVKILLPGAKIDSFDAADALAVAICHANHKVINNYTGTKV